jgi:outer membrane protein assembly factor BamB
MISRILLAVGVVVLPWTLEAADWPQWRGPNRDGVSKETGLLKKWPKDGPELAWTFDKAGSGYAGPVLVGGKLYTMGARDKVEYVLALDGKGQELWTAKIGPQFDFDSNNWSGGPNATPTVDGDMLYALGSQGELLCVDLSGKERWRKNLPKELDAQVNGIGGGPKNMGWGFSWSPLVDGEQLVCVPGGPKGLLAALDKKSGEVLWRSKEVADQATYGSPLAATIGGVKQYIQMTQAGIVGVAAKDGSLLWSYKRENPFPDVVCATPICHEDKVYLSAGWGGGAELLKIEADGQKFKATPAWAEDEIGERTIGNRHGGVVRVGAEVYGYHEDRAWVCQDFASGKSKWESGRNGLGSGSVGSLVYADGRLYCLGQKNKAGVVGMLEATPKKYSEINRFTLPRTSALRKKSGGVWTVPVIADGYLYLRDQELIFCYKVK